MWNDPSTLGSWDRSSGSFDNETRLETQHVTAPSVALACTQSNHRLLNAKQDCIHTASNCLVDDSHRFVNNITKLATTGASRAPYVQYNHTVL